MKKTERLPDIHATTRINAVIVLSDGRFFLGTGLGVCGKTEGELCFTTSMTGYQETITDPSYTGQLITFTAPHIGNVGTTPDDDESDAPACNGIVLRNAITKPANFRSTLSFTDWLKHHKLIGISGVDTRALTRHMSRNTPQHACIMAVSPGETLPVSALYTDIKDKPNLAHQELSRAVMKKTAYTWDNTGLYPNGQAIAPRRPAAYHVVVLDYGTKKSILRHLVSAGFRVTVLPGDSHYDVIMQHKPDGVFLSNGPGDPAATSAFTAPIIRRLLDQKIPLFGICLGNQLLALAGSIGTYKMKQGHRGVNHPVQVLASKKVFITSQNHGFCVQAATPTDDLIITHISLFDKSIEGMRWRDKPAFSVQFHPESSPGPHDCHDVFDQFYQLIENQDSHNATA